MNGNGFQFMKIYIGIGGFEFWSGVTRSPGLVFHIVLAWTKLEKITHEIFTSVYRADIRGHNIINAGQTYLKQIFKVIVILNFQSL